MQPIGPDSRAIVLASGSPRRLELTRRIGFEPLVRVSAIEERRGDGESPVEYARRLAEDKARDVADRIDGGEMPGWILSADTIVVHRGDVLEKPDDAADARRMLRRMSGDKHRVITAFCWLFDGGDDAETVCRVVDVSSEVWLRELDDEMIERYVATGEPMDKAGSYGIQDIGSTLVCRIEGSHFCIVGLPVCEVVATLQNLGGLVSYPFDEETK